MEELRTEPTWWKPAFESPRVKPRRRLEARAGPRLARIESRWFQVNDWRVHARVSVNPAPEDAPPVVLVHGLVVSSRYLLPTALRLAIRHRVYVPDLPGFGLSDKPEETLDIGELADALGGFVDAAGLQRPILLANSLGCQTVAALAAKRPDACSRLVLVGPTTEVSSASATSQIAKWLLNMVREQAPAQLPLMVRDYAEAGLRRAVRTFRAALNDRIDEHLARVKVPVLIVRGARDPIVPRRWADRLVRVTPDARLREIPGGAHTLNFSAPLELVRVVEPFIRDAREGARE